MTVPLPAVPASEAVCRWCTGRRVQLSTGDWYCPAGCAATDQALYPGRCEDCGREFQTGRRYAGDQCWECHQRQHRATVAMYADTGTRDRGYEADMRRKGAQRMVGRD